MSRRSGEKRRVRLRGWLVPTLLGPALGACLFVVAHAMVSGLGLGRVAAELVASVVIGLVLGAVLGLVDLGLLVTRLRVPPTAGRAWLSSSLAGACAVLLWRWLRPSLLSTPATHLAAIGVALVASALVVRVLAGKKPGAWFRFS